MRLGLRSSIAVALLLVTSCKKVPVAVVAPSPAPAAALQSGNREFAGGDYSAAARDFEHYLELVTSGGARDQALYHLGLIYALPGDGRQDWARAGGFLSRLVGEFPQSPLKPAAQVILSLRDQASQLTVDIARLTNETARLKGNADQLTQEVDKREQRIKQLNTELERLIRVDSERRPRP